MSKRKKIRILVHLHLYYQRQLDYFIKKLKNISNCDWDLYVTILKHNEMIEKKILDFKPDAKIALVDNIGYDVWPFIQIIRQVNLDEYDYVLKLHTKAYRIRENDFNGICCYGYDWRNCLVDTILKNKRHFKKIIKVFNDDENLGSIDKDILHWQISHDWPEETYLLDDELARINFKSNYRYFNAGTMFITRASVFKFLQKIDINKNMFEAKYKTNSIGTLAHVYERIFSIAVVEQGYHVKTIEDNLEKFKLNLKRIKASLRVIKFIMLD